MQTACGIIPFVDRERIVLTVDNYTFSATGHTGFEEEILRLRNANRSISQNRTYLEWRYAKYANVPAPIIFWMKSAQGDTVGMASLIFRPYLVNNKRLDLAMLGDISLDAGLRGKGLGRKLLEYVMQYLAQHMPDSAAFVIPNEAARKSLISAGWKNEGSLVPYVLPLDPADKLCGPLRSRFLASRASGLIRKLISIFARLHIRKGYTLQLVDKLDDSFGALWQDISKDNLIIGDRGERSLTWRYIGHPNTKFSIAKFLRNDIPAGYVIFAPSQSDKTIYIYDMLVKEQKDRLCMLALFLLYLIQHSGFSMIRLVLNDKHPYRGALWKLGFIQRHDRGTFLVHWPNGFANKGAANWALSLGDKDI